MDWYLMYAASIVVAAGIVGGYAAANGNLRVAGNAIAFVVGTAIAFVVTRGWFGW